MEFGGGLLSDKDALFALAAQLMQARKGQELPAFGQGLLSAMQARNAGEDRKQKGLLQAQYAERNTMEMDALRRQAEQAKKMDSLPGQFFGPQAPQHGPMPDGNSMPQLPPRNDAAGYANALMGMDPGKGMAFQAQLAQMKAKNYQKLGPGDSLYDVTDNRAVFTAPDKPKTPEQGKLRDIFKGGNVVQQEWTGDNWREVGTGPRFKPNEPDKPAAPQLYNGPNGPMWVTPPTRGQAGTIPVAGPDGQPIPPVVKPEVKLTEGESKATLYTGMMQHAEKSISSLKGFDPTTLKNQTEIALARGDLPGVPKLLQNATAGKQAQQYAQGTFQWTEAVLRQLTGAAAPEVEVWRQAKTYWPQPGDSKVVIKQKNEARAKVGEMVRIVAGKGAMQVDALNTQKEDPLGIR